MSLKIDKDNHDLGCTCKHCHNFEDSKKENTKKIIQIILAVLVFAFGIVTEKVEVIGEVIPPLYVFIIAYLIIGVEIVYRALINLFHGKLFDEHFLMSLATIAAFFVKEYSEAVVVMLLYQIGELLQDIAIQKSHVSIKTLLEMDEIMVKVVKGDLVIEKHIKEVKEGDIFCVDKGERIPLDGIVYEGSTLLNMAPLMGENIQLSKGVDESVLSGSINLNNPIKVKAIKEYNESTVNKILDCIEETTLSKGQSEKFIKSFSKIYTPCVVILSIVIAIIPPLLLTESFSPWIYRAATLLVVACPCALVISVPLAFYIGLGISSKKGILMQGSNYLKLINYQENNFGEISSSDNVEITKKISKATIRIVRQNIVLIIVIKAGALICGAFGYLPIWVATLADSGVCLLTILNTLRLFIYGKRL